MASHVLTGAHINVYINNKLYRVAQSVSFDIDYGETEIYGIDGAYPQEIASTKITVKGRMTIIRVKNAGGIQADNMRPFYTDTASSAYISIRISDRQSGEDILFVPQAKISRESHSIATKSTYKVTLEWTGIIPLTPIDRAFGED